MMDVYDALVDLYLNPSVPFVDSPTTRAQVLRNVHIIQARAFLALSSYVLERNGTSLNFTMPAHSVVAPLLKTALKKHDAWMPKGTYPDEGDDAVKWAEPLSGLARAIDLYLALENAYCHYGGQGNAAAQARNRSAAALALSPDPRNSRM